MPSRTSNSVDFWRGVALAMIFVDHVPGNVYSFLTVRNFALCDAAELFVFLAGWSLSYATGGPLTPQPAKYVVLRLLARALEIYRAQIVLTAIALAMLAATAVLRNNPIFLEWHNAGPAFFDTARATIGWVLLTHQLWFFDILPLYVVLMLAAPALLLLLRWNRWVGLGISLAIYTLTLTLDLKLPTWPGDGSWLFNPLAWQLMLVLGLLGSELAQSSDRFVAGMQRMIPVAAIAVIAFAAIRMSEFDPDPLAVPEPRFFFLIDKTNLSPARIASLIALIIAFQRVFPMINRLSARAGSWLCSLGRSSLAVFAVGSLLSLAGQLVRFILGASLTLDTFTVVLGLLGMGLTAWFVEWRSRSAGSAVRRSS